MTKDPRSLSLYALNFALLFTHQIDSAYWKEWELFHFPGGLQNNLVLNFVLLLVALRGFSLVLQGASIGYLFLAQWRHPFSHARIDRSSCCKPGGVTCTGHACDRESYCLK